MFSFFNESVKTHTRKLRNYLFSQKAQVRGRLAFTKKKPLLAQFFYWAQLRM